MRTKNKIRLHPSEWGEFRWHAHCCTWRHAGWLFERALLLVDTRREQFSVHPLPLGPKPWQVVAIAPDGRWVASSVPSGHGADICAVRGTNPAEIMKIPWTDLYSWTWIDARGEVQSLTRPFFGSLFLGRELAKAMFNKVPWHFPLRNQATGTLQDDGCSISRIVGSGPSLHVELMEVRDVHPTHNGLVIFRDQKTAQTFCGSPAHKDSAHALSEGSLWSWTRLGSVLLWGPQGGISVLEGPGGSFSTFGELGGLGGCGKMAPWEDARGGIWSLFENELIQLAPVVDWLSRLWLSRLRVAFEFIDQEPPVSTYLARAFKLP